MFYSIHILLSKGLDLRKLFCEERRLGVGGAKKLQHLQLGRGAHSWLADVHPAEALLKFISKSKTE